MVQLKPPIRLFDEHCTSPSTLCSRFTEIQRWLDFFLNFKPGIIVALALPLDVHLFWGMGWGLIILCHCHHKSVCLLLRTWVRTCHFTAPLCWRDHSSYGVWWHHTAGGVEWIVMPVLYRVLTKNLSACHSFRPGQLSFTLPVILHHSPYKLHSCAALFWLTAPLPTTHPAITSFSGSKFCQQSTISKYTVHRAWSNSCLIVWV